jgi:hypothetical protein
LRILREKRDFMAPSSERAAQVEDGLDDATVLGDDFRKVVSDSHGPTPTA